MTTVSVVKGRSTLDGLDPWVRITVGGLLLLALVFATLGIFFGMRAGYGLPRREEWEPTARELLQRERREALDAVTDLRRSIALSFATVAALVAAIAFTWYGPAEAPNSRTDVAMNDRHPTEHLGR
ncbi:hypothetical protein [Actinomadura sp. HBU206391]|uniref:hypothetical protein n=1 Tax=Actinomadura sp. HBU206391 TaxID=2731692 RepID=UPI00164EE4B4|nr:hypothetical protein [Actinomadura sp. HBU206391]MBC6460045.1 hypothetical protein [Actinomadura sp. HBU206391]